MLEMWLSLFLIILSIWLTLSCWRLRYWKRLGVPVPATPWPLMGNIGSRLLLQTSFHDLELWLYQRCSGLKYAGFYEGSRPVLMIRDPELIRAVLVRDFEYFTDRPTIQLRRDNYLAHMLITLKGAHWKSVRAILTRAFSSGRLHAMSSLLEHSARQLVEYLGRRDPKDGFEMEAKELFGRYTMDTIASVAFGVQCDSLKDTDADFVKRMSHFNYVSLTHYLRILLVLLFCPWAARYIRLHFLHQPTMDFLAEVVRQTREHRAKSKENRRNDFLQLLLDNETNLLTEDLLIGQALLFLIAGYDASSNTLACAAYELALNPDIQDRARKEAETGDGNEYLQMVINETLRLHPVLAKLERSVIAPYELDPSIGLVLYPKNTISVNVIGLHMDPQYYPEPDKFIPERFAVEEKMKRSPYVYLPFGAGPRNCLGARFVMLSARIALTHVLRSFEFKVCGKTEIPITLNKRTFSFEASAGIWINVVPLIDTQE